MSRKLTSAAIFLPLLLKSLLCRFILVFSSRLNIAEFAANKHEHHKAAILVTQVYRETSSTFIHYRCDYIQQWIQNAAISTKTVKNLTNAVLQP